jgi:hypothetical protein
MKTGFNVSMTKLNEDEKRYELGNVFGGIFAIFLFVILTVYFGGKLQTVF